MAVELSQQYNPDVLTCLANLSNDEVFTPPELVNNMLDLLPAELWQNREARFLDPVTKSGVFLREIAKRLNEGLKDQIPDQQFRLNHIFTQQVFGIAITELTAWLARRSVYCSKTANSQFSICNSFNTPQGNIRYLNTKHIWQNGKCKFCGASQEVYDRPDNLESHAYEFIHTNNPSSIFGKDMKFDVIIGNPPYQLSDGGHGRSASPIYQRFVEQAKKLDPKYLAMIIPARWFSGGKGLDEFRGVMLNDANVRVLVDFENSNDVFPGVDVAGGICYFLRDRDNEGPCEVVNMSESVPKVSMRYLNEFEIFVRHSISVPLLRRIRSDKSNKQYLNEVVSPSKPFGIRGHHQPSKNGVPCHFTQKQGVLFVAKEDITDNYNILNKFKLLIPRAPIAGQTDFSKPVGFYYDGNVRIAKPGEACTESWLVAYASENLDEVVSFKSYLFTKVVRFLLLQTVVSQDVTRDRFIFVPHIQNYDKKFTDEILIEEWQITPDEWSFIDSKIKSIA